jgi:hypothetical protein
MGSRTWNPQVGVPAEAPPEAYRNKAEAKRKTATDSLATVLWAPTVTPRSLQCHYPRRGCGSSMGSPDSPTISPTLPKPQTYTQSQGSTGVGVAEEQQALKADRLGWWQTPML